ncbi:MAG: site-specific integrase [Chloroflexi bacterium]|nr:site-specific integrase [Chloroflexota bacterium]
MSRRARNEGSIFKRKDGRWVAQLTYTEGGQRRRRAFYASTQAEARQKLSAARRQLDDGAPLPPERGTVGEYLTTWLGKKEPSLRPESFRRYREACYLHLIPILGNRPLAKLTPIDVENAYAKLRIKELSGTTIALVHGVLHKALKDAARAQLVIRNVADLVDAPRRSTPTMATLTPEQAQALLLAARDDLHEAFYVVALTSGMRLGELQALKWGAVDLERRRLHVVATYQGTQDGEPVFAEPKTEKSRRSVHLSEMAVGALQRNRARQAETRLRAGGAWQDYDLVFATALGRPLDGNNLRTRSFARLLDRAGLPPMRFHTLRHAAATLLMSEGVPVKAISEMLGHSDISTTLRIYAHVLPTAHEQAASAMDRLFSDAH